MSLIKNQLLSQANQSLFQPELYQHLLLILLTICRSHVENLALISSPVTQIFRTCFRDDEPKDGEVPDCVAEGSGLWTELVDKLNEVFWALYRKRPSNLNIAPVCNTGTCTCTSTCAYMQHNLHVHVFCDN